MRFIGEVEPDLFRHHIISEMESEGVRITIDTEERLLTAHFPPQMRKDLLVNFALRLKFITTEDLCDDYTITLSTIGEVTIKVHYHAAKYREIG